MIALVLVILSAAPLGPPADLPPCPSDRDTPDLAKLLTRMEFVQAGASSEAVMTMSIRTPAWSRTLKMKVTTKGRDYSLVKVVSGGPRETGMMMLKREKQLWNWLPQAGRVMKLPAGMLGDSWLGSDFTNDDLVRGSSLATDFDAKLGAPAEIDGRKAWHLVLTPKKDAVVVWSRIEVDLDRATCVPLLERFFDDEGKQMRKMAFSDVKQLGWRAFASKMTVTPADPGRETVIQWDTITFDVDIPDEVFSVHHLQQGR